MKYLPLFLLTLTHPAQAGTLDCSGPGLSYSYNATDGGAPRDPFIDLVLNGKVLVHKAMFEQGVELATFQLIGHQKVLKTEKSPEYITTTYESRAKVTMNGETEAVFDSTVLCRDSRYVGPPRP